MAKSETIKTDYLVIGSGISGLYFAMNAKEHGKVVVLAKEKTDHTNTNWAQGGIAAVLGKDDTNEKHIEDTLRVGEGLCNKDIVSKTISEGPDHVRKLSEYGVPFDMDNEGSYKLTREGGHSERRVAFHKDTTGQAIQQTLLETIAKEENITVFEDHIAVDLLSTAKYGEEPACFGAYVLDNKTGQVKTLLARATVLATGGSGKVYIYTSNPDVASGDGVAMAYRIGADVGNMEFVQFHPTVLYHPHAKSFLISETLRGEGGELTLQNGNTFMENYHPRKSLGPRDVVARAIDNELKKSGEPSVLLDMTKLDGPFIKKRFPAIASRCQNLGIDIAKQGIPVVPAAHYQCGGVLTDEHGQTSIKNLFAIGEVAHTGLHGACRLASNSLLEGVVFGARAAKAVKNTEFAGPTSVEPWHSGDATDSNDAIVVSLNWDEIRRFMWSYVGIVRSDKRIERAMHRIELLRQEIKEYYWDFKITSDMIELRNLALVSHLIIESAKRRKESRGLHYTLDYLDKDDNFKKDTVLNKENGVPLL